MPVIVLWWRSFGWSQFQITLILSVFFLSTLLMEIPSGILSDRLGHKWSLAICGFFFTASILVLAYGNHVGLAILGEFLGGVGNAFYTGSKEAYLYNYLQRNQSDHLYQKYFSQAKLFEFIGMAFGALVGGSVYTYSPQLPFFLSAGAFFLSMIVAMFLEEPASRGSGQTVSWHQVVHGFEKIGAGPADLKRLVFYFCFIFTSILIFTISLIQPYLKSSGLPIATFGLVYLFFNGAAMGGSELARRLPGRVFSKFFFGLGLLLALTFVGLAEFQHPTSFLIIGAVYLAWGLFFPSVSQATNRLIDSETRATVLSTQDFLQNLLFVTLAPLIGLAADHWGYSAALLLLAGMAFLPAVLALQLQP